MSKVTENYTITNIGATLVKAIMQSNPVTGFVQTIYDEYACKQWQQRREKWEETLEKEFQELKDDMDFSKIQTISNFAPILANAAQGAMCDLEEDKVKLYINVVINALKKEKINDTKTHIFLNMLRNFTLLHIKMLQFFNSIERKSGKSSAHTLGIRENDQTWHEIVQQCNPELFKDKALYHIVYDDLVNQKMLKDSYVSYTTNSKTYPAKQTTILADEFLEFISK